METSVNETRSTSILRTVGFGCLAIVDMLTMINFMISIGESWILPFMGGVLVFMKIWNWVASLKAHALRKALHLIAWGSISMLSIIAVISFGLAITSASNNDAAQALKLQSLKDAALSTQLQSLNSERSSIQTQIDDIILKESKLTQYDRTARTSLEAQLKETRARADELDKKIAAFGDTSARVEVKKSSVVNAQLIFSQIFSDALARPAIWGFFFILGVAVELTLALSSSAPKEEEEFKRRKRKTSKKLQKVKDSEDSEEDSDENNEEDDLLEKSVPKEVEKNETVKIEEAEPIEEKKETVKIEEKKEEVKPIEEKKDSIYNPEVIEKLAEQSKPQVEEKSIEITVPKEGKVEVSQFLEKVENKHIEKEDKQVENFTNVINKMFTKIDNGKAYLLSEEELSRELNMNLDRVKKIYKYFEYLDLIYLDRSANLWKPKKEKSIFADIVKSKLIKK